MGEGDSVSERLKEARFQTAARLRESVSQERMAELVGEELGRVMHPTQWRRYEAGTEPPLDVIQAAARCSGLTASYIAFGAEGGPPQLPGGARFEGDYARVAERPPTAKKKKSG
jgi:hypothetical protein